MKAFMATSCRHLPFGRALVRQYVLAPGPPSSRLYNLFRFLSQEERETPS